EFQKTVSLFAKREMVFCAQPVRTLAVYATLLRLIGSRSRSRAGTAVSPPITPYNPLKKRKTIIYET
ncbi:MAG: hypothetical protein RSE97_05255, partial [Oscillospiraceae bacterium]